MLLQVGAMISSIAPNSTCSCSGAEQSREGLIIREAPRLQEGLYSFVMLGSFLSGKGLFHCVAYSSIRYFSVNCMTILGQKRIREFLYGERGDLTSFLLLLSLVDHWSLSFQAVVMQAVVMACQAVMTHQSSTGPV